ncbi:MAG: hypothetical protein PUD50_02475 [Eubacteriales bacterium]|nr:hypothetical protein [Eubacteriales bacterium]
MLQDFTSIGRLIAAFPSAAVQIAAAEGFARIQFGGKLFANALRKPRTCSNGRLFSPPPARRRFAAVVELGHGEKPSQKTWSHIIDVTPPDCRKTQGTHEGASDHSKSAVHVGNPDPENLDAARLLSVFTNKRIASFSPKSGADVAIKARKRIEAAGIRRISAKSGESGRGGGIVPLSTSLSKRLFGQADGATSSM